MSDLSLQVADAYCAAMTAGHYENFVVSSGLVPKEMRTDLARIYAFCRTTDDLGDESASKEDALHRLARWRDELRAMCAGETPVHPVLFALRETIAARQMDEQPFFDLIEANVLDQKQSTYERWADLEAYCYLSAAPVGRMVLSVFGITSPRAAKLSDDVCNGLQLANHAQDVRRDAANGRRYLLEEDVREHGEQGAIRALVLRARALLDSGRELETMAPFALRLQLSLYRMGGAAICDAIERLDYRTDEERPTVGGRAKMTILASAFWHALRSNGTAARIETA